MKAKPETSSTSARELRVLAALGLLSLGFVAWLFHRYHNALFLGDGYIFLRYAENLAQRHEWSFNPGEPSYGSSSVSWTLLLAALKLFVPSKQAFIVSAVYLDLLFFFGSAFLWWRLLQHVTAQRWLRMLLVGLYIAWPFNGVAFAAAAMETGLFLFLFQGACLAALRLESDRTGKSAVTVAIWVGLLCLTRLEGVLLLGLVPLWYWSRSRAAGSGVSAAQVLAFVFLGALPLVAWACWAVNSFGRILPSSARGRLYGYLQSVVPSVSLEGFQQLSILGRALLLPEIFRTQFIRHPVALMTCVLPIALGGLCYLGLILSRRALPNGRSIAHLVAAYVALNALVYLLFQPLIVQRYLVTALPIALLLLAVLVEEKRWEIPPAMRAASAALAVLVTGVSAVAFVPYYRTGAVQNHEIAEILTRFSQEAPRSPGGFSLAAESLGLAGYFTDARIVDLGGLIDPEIWEFWERTEGKTIPFPTCGLPASYQFAIQAGADYVLTNTNEKLKDGFAPTPVVGPDGSGRVILKVIGAPRPAAIGKGKTARGGPA